MKRLQTFLGGMSGGAFAMLALFLLTALVPSVSSSTISSLAQLPQIATDRLLGRDTPGTGDVESLTVGGGLEFTGSGGVQRSALTGDATASAGSGVMTVAKVGGTAYGTDGLAALGSTHLKRGEWVNLGTVTLAASAPPDNLTDAQMTGQVAGGSVSAPTVGLLAGSYSAVTNETGTASPGAGLGAAAAADRPYPVADYPGIYSDLNLPCQLTKADGDAVIVADLIPLAAVADLDAPVEALLSYRSDLAANAKWRLWPTYRANATGYWTSATPTVALSSVTVTCPRVTTEAALTVRGSFGAPQVGSAAAEIGAGAFLGAGAYASAPAAVDGYFYFANDSPIVRHRASGAYVDELSPWGVLTVPTVAGVTALNSAVLTDLGGLVIRETTLAGSDRIRGAYVTTRASPYSICAVFDGPGFRENFMSAGIFLSDGTKLLTLALANTCSTYSPCMSADRWNSVTSYASTIAFAAFNNGGGERTEFCISDDGTNRKYWASFDGTNFNQLTSIVDTDWFTTAAAVRAGMFINSNNATWASQARFYDFRQTAGGTPAAP